MDFSSKTGILVVKFTFATANLKIKTLRMRRRFARVSVWPELPIPTTGQKDRGLWGREWAYLIESSHSRLQGPRSFWSEGPSQRSRFLVLTKGAGPLGTGIKRLVIEPNRTIVIPTKSNSRLPNGRQSYSIKRAITELLFVWFWCSNINNDNKMAKYDPIIKQVNILRKFCTLNRPPYPHRILY